MAEIMNPRITSLVSDDTADDLKNELLKIWNGLRNPHEISSGHSWPFPKIITHAKKFVPATHQSAGELPITIATFLYQDLRLVLGNDARLDMAAGNMLEDHIKKYRHFWVEILYGIFRNYCGLQIPRTRGVAAKRNAIIKCIYGTENDDTEPQPATTHEASQSTVTHITTTPHINSTTDLPKSIQAMTNIIPFGERLGGDEIKLFIDRLEPILDQIKAAGISEVDQPVVLYSLTSGKVQDAAKKININDTSIDALVDHLKESCYYDKDIQDRRASRWQEIKYSDFRARHATEDGVTRACIDFVTTAHKDLPKHLLSDESLRSRIRAIFMGQHWCDSLYERSSGHETAHMFSQKLITAAGRYDTKKTIKEESSANINHVHQNQYKSSQGTASGMSDASLIAFFAKTPPPHYTRRPNRFRYKTPYYRSRYGQGRSNYRRNRYPQLLGSRSVRRCYGCKQVEDILRNCPQKHQHMDRFNNLVSLGNAASMIVSSVSQEEDDEKLDEIASYIDEAEKCIIEENDEYPEFSEWVNHLLQTLDGSGTGTIPQIDITQTHHSSFHHVQCMEYSNDAFYLRFTIDDLMKMYEAFANAISSMEKISLFMLIDTGAPKSICSDSWLAELKWTPVQTRQPPPTIKPFRFAGNPVPPQQIACLFVKISDVNGNNHYLRQVVFILPSVPIPFLLGLQTQHALGVDICLRQKNGSHVRVDKWNSTVHLSVSSHLWLKFEPVHTDPEPHFNCEPLINAALDPSLMDVNFVFPVNSPTPPTGLNINTDVENSYYPTPPWERDNWISGLNGKEIDKIHKTLRHPEPTSMLQFFRQQREQRKLPKSIRTEIEQLTCKDRDEHVQLPPYRRFRYPLLLHRILLSRLISCNTPSTTDRSRFSSYWMLEI